MSKSKRVRLNLEFSAEVRDRIGAMRAATDAASDAEVVRRALATYETILKYRNSDGRIVLAGDGGKTTEIIII